MLTRTIAQDPEEVRRRYLAPVAEHWNLADSRRALGHDPVGWTRHGAECISWCGDRRARIYARLGEPRTQDGKALTDPCPA